jgi:protein O-GlcNAc transferase
MASIEEAFEFALSHHQSGCLNEAEIIYERVLEAAPGHVATLFYAGILAIDLGKIDIALTRLTKAAGAAPSFADAHYNLGVALGLSGRGEEACARYKRVLALDPAYTAALTNLGLAALDDRESSSSIHLLTAAVRLDCENSSAWFNLGRALREADRLEESRLSLRRSLALAPHSAAARNAANVLKDAVIRRHLDAGFASLKTDSVDDQAFQAAYVDGPDYPLVWIGFALAREAQGAFDAAVDAARKAAALDPLNPFSEKLIGRCFRQTGRYGDAPPHLERAAKLQPEDAESWFILAQSRFESGDAVQALAAVRRAAALDPLSETIRDTLLFMALACPEIDNAALAEEAEAFCRNFGGTLAASAPAVRLKQDGRLRIGYISGAISEGHNALYFLEPLLRHHDRTQVCVRLYGDVPYRNPAQTRLTEMVDGWFDTTGLDDEAVAAQIRADGVDVLIGLLGRGSRHPRVEIFKRRPAPVQIAFHHVMSTGVDAVDYWLTDLTAHPRDTTERFSERLIRLPRYCQYQPPWEAPEPSPPPALNNRYVTFGSFTSRWKISDPTLALWGRILKGSPGARLLLKGDGLESEAICESFRRRFEQNGGDAAFLDFRPADRNYLDHLAAYGDIDIALDTWPYSYGNTGFEALWMGAPVVTLAGDRFAGRMGAAILKAAGLSRWIADTPDAYVAAALTLAEDQDQRSYWRSRLRDHLRASRLLNGRAYARHVERVCRWAVARL